MANPIAIAAMLSRMVTITCPHCRHKKVIQKKPAAFRVCPNCKHKFPDPLSTMKKK